MFKLLNIVYMTFDNTIGEFDALRIESIRENKHKKVFFSGRTTKGGGVL